MDMQENNIKNVVNGISYPEDTKARIWEGISRKHMEENRKKDVADRVIGRRTKAVVALACMIVLIVIINMKTGSPYGTQISVYAKNSDGEKTQVVMSPGKQVEVEPVKVSDGYGYVFEVDLQDDYTYTYTYTYATEVDNTNAVGCEFVNMNQPSDSIYITVTEAVSDQFDPDKENSFVKFQYDGIDGWINAEYLNNIALAITIYNDLNEVYETKTIQFETIDGRCIAVLKD